MPTPLVIVVTGLPCSGKSTLGRRISGHFALPFISKDAYKEALFDTLGWSDREWSKKLSAASYAMMFATLNALLEAGQSCVLEANFHPGTHSQPLEQITRTHSATVFQVQCVTEPNVLLERFSSRWQRGERHPGHADHVTLPEMEDLAWQVIPPLSLPGPIWTLETTDLDALETDTLMARIGETLAANTV